VESPRTHFVIPDCQVKPGVPIDHIGWIGEYLVERKPSTVICLGDFADMESLSLDFLCRKYEGVSLSKFAARRF
jgi:hypothetical protein